MEQFGTDFNDNMYEGINQDQQDKLGMKFGIYNEVNLHI